MRGLKTLKNRLKSSVKVCYLLEGDDLYLFDKAISMIKKACNLELEEFNLSVFDDENYSMKAILDACEVMPMVGDKKVVLLKNISKVTESDKKLLEKYLTSPLESTCLIISDFDGKFASIKTKTESVDCKRMDRNLATAVIVAELSKQDKQISGEAVATLLDYCNGYLTGVMNELDKLINYDASQSLVTKKVVEEVVSKATEFTVFELTEALGKKDSDKALELVSLMEKDISTLSLITNHFRRLFFIAISDSSDSELASLLGVKEYAITKARGQVKNFSKMQLKKIYALLEKVDYFIKSGQMLSLNALYYLVFSILYI